MMGLLIEEEEEKLCVKIYPNGEGSDNAAEYEGEIITIPIASTIPNEPFKDLSYMENNDDIKNMIRSINDGEEFPPIKVIEHPLDPTKYVVVDGNHRRFAFSKSEKEDIDAIIIPHEDVLLMKNKWGSEDNTGIKLSEVNDEEIINSYFVQPDGNHSFENRNREKIYESKKELNSKFKFSNYEETLDFVNKVAKIAKKQNHHPDINFDYNNVEISITDHEKGGVSDKCHKFMGAVDKLTNKKSETNEDKESGEKWIKCRNCKKKFTQTIHKGKKSLPICPHCGTHNAKEKSEQNESELSERCWKGYTQKGMKTMFGKRYPNCVKKKKKMNEGGVMINEEYDSERLYKREFIVSRLKDAPKELRSYISKLPRIPCENDLGERSICTKIPEVLYVYFRGDY